jgi:hypothetical protein
MSTINKRISTWHPFLSLDTILIRDARRVGKGEKLDFSKHLINPFKLHYYLDIMLRDLFTQKFVHKFLVTDFGYPRLPEHVDSEKLNRQIDLGPALYQLFSKSTS